MTGNVATAPLPLREILPTDVGMLNAFYRRRDPIQFEVDGLQVVASTQAPHNGGLKGDTYCIDISFGNTGAQLLLERGLAEFMMQRFEKGLSIGSDLPPAHAALIVEAFMASGLASIERLLGVTVTLENAGLMVPEKPDNHTIDLALRVQDYGTSTAQVRIPRTDAFLFLRLIKIAARPKPFRIDLTFPLSIQLLPVQIAAGKLKELKAGDVIMIAEFKTGQPRVTALLANSYVYPVSLSVEGVKITGPLSSAAGSPWELNMSKEPKPSPSGTNFAQLPVNVIFELGRIDLPFSELTTLNAGSVLPLARPLEQSVDIIANGARVGRGMIVKIGDSVGVEVVRMFDGA